jgi:hypothetical protein
MNFYRYPADPLGWIDPVGLTEAKTFSSADKAALNILKTTNPKSIRNNKEYAGMICKKEVPSEKCSKGSLTCNKTVFFATEPKKGTLAGASPSESPCPPDSTPVGDYHTHGDYSLTDGIRATAATDAYDSLHFSVTDILDNDASGLTGYLGTPNGTFLKYEPSTGIIGELK